MNPQAIIASAKVRIDKAISRLSGELATLRTGRAHAGIVEHVRVESYGQVVPLKAVASITVPDARTITIAPWDQANVVVIEKAIREDTVLGLNPSSDGRVIRLNIAPMTEDRRHEIVKDLKSKVEDCNIALRTIRHDGINEARRFEKSNDFTKDDVSRVEAEFTKLLDNAKQVVEALAAAKERDVMTVQ